MNFVFPSSPLRLPSASLGWQELPTAPPACPWSTGVLRLQPAPSALRPRAGKFRCKCFSRKNLRATETPQKSFWHRSSRSCRCPNPFKPRVNRPSAKAENSTPWPYSIGRVSLLQGFEHLRTKMWRVVRGLKTDRWIRKLSVIAEVEAIVLTAR